MRDRVLHKLKTTQDYISGQELCDSLGVSRTAIWKAIHALEEAGYEIEAVRNRGYRLISSPDVLFSDEIKSILDTKWFGREVVFCDTIDSTNNEVKRRAEAGGLEGLLVIGEEQLAGRGRRGRNWVSPPGTGIWMSFLLRPDLLPEEASMLTIVAALACQRGISQFTSEAVGIKWPNDLVMHQKKLAGILTEMSTELTSIHYVVIGIGINVATESFPEELKEQATSLLQETGQNIKRSSLVAAIGKEFELLYEGFLEHRNLEYLREEYEQKLVNKNQYVAIHEAKGTQTGTAQGISPKGELLVIDSQGKEIRVGAGEVSVRGIYGYQ